MWRHHPAQTHEEFEIPEALLKAHVTSARIVSPSDRTVDMPIDSGFVGMVDRDEFDEWLRTRAGAAGAIRRVGTFERISRDSDDFAVIHYRNSEQHRSVRARAVIGVRTGVLGSRINA